MNQSIGVFDSGVGGLTVMKELISVLPNESIVYFGDTARLPYGNKSPETIIKYSLENAEFLLEKEIKALVVACNTSTAYALGHLRELLNIPVIGVIEPGAKRAVSVTQNKHIVILGTKATINSQAYEREIKALLPGAVVTSIACPLFVPLVEERFVDHPAARLVAEEYFQRLEALDYDTVLLGCTHYPILRNLIQQVLKPDVNIVDSALTCAETVKQILGMKGMLNSLKEQNPAQGVHGAVYRFYVSDDTEKFRLMGCDFLGRPISHVEKRLSNFG